MREQAAVHGKAVAVTGHLVGHSFTFADINLMPIVYRLQQAPEGARIVVAARISWRTTGGTRRGRASSARLRPPGRPRSAQAAAEIDCKHLSLSLSMSVLKYHSRTY